MQYNQLVREKVIERIEKDGKKAIIEILDDETYEKKLDEKLLEETNEYLKEGSLEKLGDIVEVVLAILKFNDLNLGDLIEILDDKKEKEGGFEKKILLKEVK